MLAYCQDIFQWNLDKNTTVFIEKKYLQTGSLFVMATTWLRDLLMLDLNLHGSPMHKYVSKHLKHTVVLSFEAIV